MGTHLIHHHDDEDVLIIHDHVINPRYNSGRGYC